MFFHHVLSGTCLRTRGASRLILVAVASLAATMGALQTRSALAADAPSSAGTHFVKNMDANFRNVDPNNPLCKGTFGVSDMSDAEALHEAIGRSYNFANMAAGRVPTSDHSHPEVAAAFKKLEGLRVCHGAVGQRLRTLQAEAAQQEGRYDAFMRAGQAYAQTVERLLMFADDLQNNQMYTPQPDELTKWRDDLRAIHGLCTGEFKGVTNPPRGPLGPERDALKWCKLGANADAIGQRLAINYVRSLAKLALDAMNDILRDFEARDGYLALQGTLVEQAFFAPAAFKAEMDKRAGPVLQAAGVGSAGDTWAEFDRLHKAVWDKIDAAAPNWKPPASAGAGPAAAAAKATLGKEKGVKVLSAWLTRADWQLHRNAAGVVLRRSQPGYVVYKTPADKQWCRGRSWAYIEQASGRGFQKSREVSELGFIRFEACR